MATTTTTTTTAVATVAATPKKAVTVKDVAAADFIAAYARHLKRSGRVELPKWVDLVKTAAHKELSPYDPDWYFVRAASIARKIYLQGGTGITHLRRMYGSNARRGCRPPHFKLAAGSVIRHIVHSLEKLKVIEVDTKSGGRRITHIGQRDLDRIAGHVVKSKAAAASAATAAAAAAKVEKAAKEAKEAKPAGAKEGGAAKTDKAPKADKADKADKAEKAPKADKAEKADKADKAEKPKSEKAAKPAKAAKGGDKE